MEQTGEPSKTMNIFRTLVLFFVTLSAFAQSPQIRILPTQNGLVTNTGYVDYKTTMYEEWILNRGIVINAANTGVEYWNGQNSNYRLVAGTATMLTSNNEILTTTLGEGFATAFDTEITNGFGFTGDISIVLYVKKTAAHSAVQILWDSANPNLSTDPLFQFQTQISGGNLNMQFSYNAVNYPLTGQQFPYDANYHVVVIRARNDAGTIKLSVNIDGTQRGSEVSVTGSMTRWDAKNIRRFLRSSSTTWFGYVKRIRIYNEWLADATITSYLTPSNSVFKRDEVEKKRESVVASWGQSNTLGAPFSDPLQLPSDRQLSFLSTNLFSNVTSRTLTGTILAGVRPATYAPPLIEMSYQLIKKYPNENFYIIHVAASNTGMAVFWNSRASGTGWIEYSRQVVNLLMKLKAEGRTIYQVSIPDYQGETDASTTLDAGNFETNRGNFYTDISSAIVGVIPSVPIKIACGRISSGLSIGAYPGRDIVRTAITNLAVTFPNLTIVNSDDLNLAWVGGDGTHYNTSQLQTIGARQAAVFFILSFFVIPRRSASKLRGPVRRGIRKFKRKIKNHIA